MQFQYQYICSSQDPENHHTMYLNERESFFQERRTAINIFKS
jgi:hypothetical protein